MVVAPGTRLGPYEITAKLGEGGMGEVWRARDTKLDRDVAIKVLPAAFTADEERLARFEREAKLLAQLHHPNIASIFGMEDSGATKALVMELVEGPTLADRLEQGSLSIEESLSIARQIAEALEEAHEKGIVHRDLKPQNIKASLEGKVKVLDFGLAKAMDPTAGAVSGSASALAQSPTLTLGATVQGVILGTAAYMAPEQAAGGTADRRADVWSFGVVLYEMLAGRRLFEGETVSHVLAGVLKDEPEFAALPAETPERIRRLLARCLRKKPRERLHSIADARIVIDEVLAGADEVASDRAATPPRRSRMLAVAPWILAAALGIAWLVTLRSGPGAGESSARRAVEVSVPAGRLLTEEGGLAFAPDGSAIVFPAVEPGKGTQLWIRRLDTFEPQPLHGTESGAFPFWTRDSKAITFFRGSDDTLCRYDLATGEIRVLRKTGTLGRGASWGEDGSLLFVLTANSPVQRIFFDGRPDETVTELDPSILDGSHRWPAWLPDGEHFLFTLWTNHLETAAKLGGIYVATLDGSAPPRRLTPDLSQAILAGPDRLLVWRENALVALPFDPERLEVTGPGEKMVDRPLYSRASGALGATATPAGDLAWASSSGTEGGQLVWLDASGGLVGTAASERLAIDALKLAPDERHFAVEAPGPTGRNIWVGDERRQVVTRLTTTGIDAMFPVWSPDSRRIAFVTEAEGTLTVYVQEADGSRPAERLLRDTERDFYPSDWSADGRHLLLSVSEKVASRTDLWVYDFTSGTARELLAGGSASLYGATLSPDGRWIAYASDESGNPEVFVRPFPALDRQWRISQDGAFAPHWRSDGRELAYLALADRSVFVAPVEPRGEELEIGIPRQLFAPTAPLLAVSPAGDHQRFLAGTLPGDVRAEPIRVLLGGLGGRR